MTPTEEAQIKQHVRAIAEIFYRNTPAEKMWAKRCCKQFALEDIEQTVREHLLKSVGPDVAFFLSKREPKRTEEKSE